MKYKITFKETTGVIERVECIWTETEETAELIAVMIGNFYGEYLTQCETKPVDP